jgi:hypothetical protein
MSSLRKVGLFAHGQATASISDHAAAGSRAKLPLPRSGLVVALLRASTSISRNVSDLADPFQLRPVPNLSS